MNKIIHQAWIKEESEYLKLFRNVKKERGIGEFSVIYLFSKLAAKEIKKFNADAKIIILLRNPTERAYSHYLMDLSAKVTKKNLLDLTNDFDPNNLEWGRRSLCLEASLYYAQIKRYLEVFPKKNIKILYFEDLKSNPQKLIKELFSFLEVDETFIADTSINHNPALIPKFKFLHNVISELKLGKLVPDILKSRIEKVYFKDKKKIPKMNSNEKRILNQLFSKDLRKFKNDLKFPKDYWN